MAVRAAAGAAGPGSTVAGGYAALELLKKLIRASAFPPATGARGRAARARAPVAPAAPLRGRAGAGAGATSSWFTSGLASLTGSLTAVAPGVAAARPGRKSAGRFAAARSAVTTFGFFGFFGFFGSSSGRVASDSASSARPIGTFAARPRSIWNCLRRPAAPAALRLGGEIRIVLGRPASSWSSSGGGEPRHQIPVLSPAPPVTADARAPRQNHSRGGTPAHSRVKLWNLKKSSGRDQRDGEGRPASVVAIVRDRTRVMSAYIS